MNKYCTKILKKRKRKKKSGVGALLKNARLFPKGIPKRRSLFALFLKSWVQIVNSFFHFLRKTQGLSRSASVVADVSYEDIAGFCEAKVAFFHTVGGILLTGVFDGIGAPKDVFVSVYLLGSPAAGLVNAG